MHEVARDSRDAASGSPLALRATFRLSQNDVRGSNCTQDSMDVNFTDMDEEDKQDTGFKFLSSAFSSSMLKILSVFRPRLADLVRYTVVKSGVSGFKNRRGN